ncbi:MAG: alpha/beta hydrolase family protein [Bacteroidetes bacterium]|nr:alpha/beta hydrolase family protein [Bacteroidota bacterium]
MNISAGFFPMLDKLYDYFTIQRICSVDIRNDFFDGRQYSINEFYENAQPFFHQPEKFYTRLNSPAEVDIVTLSKNGDDVFCAYPSPATTCFEENNTAYFRLFSNNNSGTLLLFVPGWGRKKLDAESDFCRKLLKHGIDSCLLVKPFHQERTPAGQYSGELFISPYIFMTIMNFRQLVAEIQFLLQHFRKRYANIGIIGMSSGGFQAGLALDVAPVDFYFPIITAAKLGSLTWQSIFTKYIKDDLIKKGIDEDQLNKAWAITDQLFLGQHCKAKYIKQFISLYDVAVTTKYQFLLNDIYNNPDKVEMKCGHSSVIFYFHRIANEIIKTVRERC